MSSATKIVAVPLDAQVRFKNGMSLSFDPEGISLFDEAGDVSEVVAYPPSIAAQLVASPPMQPEVEQFMRRLEMHAIGLEENGRYDPSKPSGLTNSDSVSYGGLLREAIAIIAALTALEETEPLSTQVQGDGPAFHETGGSLKVAEPTEPTIPSGMVRWDGGDSAPADWNGGPVLLRDGTVIDRGDGKAKWMHASLGSRMAQSDCFAYTPKPSTGATAPIGGHHVPDAGKLIELEQLRDTLRPLIDAVASPNGWDWMFPLRVVPVDGKPTIVSHKGGNLFRGYIATWKEADLLVALANAAPTILATLSVIDPAGEVKRIAATLWRNLTDGDHRMARENCACLGFYSRQGRLPSWEELSSAYEAMDAADSLQPHSGEKG